MIRIWPSLLTSAIVPLAPHWLSGKAPTVRITLSGRSLARPIQITDAKALQLSNAWAATFLDVSKPPLAAAPKVSSTYEVTLYSEIGTNDIRKTYVFFYSPESPAKQGLVYLPGKGSLWALNAGTIIRQGRDGKWSYASPDWEASIKPFLAIGEAERGLRPAEQQNQDSSALPDPVIEEWTRPWKQLGRVQTSVLFWSAVSSHDGKYVYAVAPAQHRVFVIDAVMLL